VRKHLTPIVAASAIGVVFLFACPTPLPELRNGVSIEEHSTYFGINTADPHALNITAQDGQPISCDSCHANTDSFQAAKCTPCHDLDATPLATAHGRVAGYLHDDVSCLSCHPNGLVDLTLRGDDTHSEIFFPIDPDDAHGDANYVTRAGGEANTCTACHASETDRSQTLCAECHANDATPLGTTHQQFTASFNAGGGATSSAGCKSCHRETPVNERVNPVTNHNGIIEFNHHQAECQNCHKQNRTDIQTWSLDFTQSTCIDCHDAACTITSIAACN
jgi:hypothetical protein